MSDMQNDPEKTRRILTRFTMALRQLGREPEVRLELSEICFKSLDHDPNIMVVDSTGESYCLQRIIGKIPKSAAYNLNRIHQDPKCHFRTAPASDGSAYLVVVTIAVGPFAGDQLDSGLVHQESWLNEMVRASQKTLAEQIPFMADGVSRKKTAPEIAGLLPFICRLPYVASPEQGRLQECVARIRAGTHSSRLIQVVGQSGAGKKTAVAAALNAEGIYGLCLVDAAGHTDASLATALKACIGGLVGRDDVALVLTDPAVRTLQSTSAEAGQTVSLLAEISCDVLVIIITDQANARVPGGMRFDFSPPAASVLRGIVQAHYGLNAMFGADARDGLAEPANTLNFNAFLCSERQSERAANLAATAAAITGKDLLDKMRQHVIGQDEVLRPLCNLVATRLAHPPVAQDDINHTVVMASGPAGVGKSESAKALARALNVNLVYLPMNEAVDAELQSTQWLGSSAGYVGFGKKCIVDDIVPGFGHRAGSVILIDELEKGDPKIRDLILGWMQDGSIRTGAGRTIYLRNCILFLTTNQGVDQLYRKTPGFIGNQGAVKLEEFYLSEAGNIGAFTTPLLSRLHLFLQYASLIGQEPLAQLVLAKLDQVLERFPTLHIDVDRPAFAHRFIECHKKLIERLGARVIGQRLLPGLLMEPFDQAIACGHECIRLSLRADGSLQVSNLGERPDLPHLQEQVSVQNLSNTTLGRSQ